MAVVRPLNTGIRVISLSVGLDTVNVQAHDLAEDLADLVLGVFILARKLQYLGQ